MEPGLTLVTAMQKAQREGRAYFVYECLPGSNAYAIVSLPPDRETYFKVEPNRIITTVVGLCTHASEKSNQADRKVQEDSVETLGGGFWFYRRDRIVRSH